MYWKHFKILLTLFLAVLLMAPVVQARNPNPGDQYGPPDDPVMPIELYEVAGSVSTIEVYPQEKVIYLQDQSHHPFACRIPVDEPPTTLFILTTASGGKYILDWGPEWYLPSLCHDGTTWVCQDVFGEEADQPVILGGFEVGYFNCEDDPLTVNSNNTFLYSEEELLEGVRLPLMTPAAKDELTSGSPAYVFGRYNETETLWLTAPTDDGSPGNTWKPDFCYDQMNADASVIVWETMAHWWRGEGAPWGKVDELSCEINE